MGIEIFKNSASTPLLVGVLQLATGTALNSTLKVVTDQANTNSPLQLSTTTVGIEASSSLTFIGRSKIKSSADGFISLFNNAETGFTGLRFGGATNSFPMIKRNSAAIDFRLADDSSFCNIEAAQIKTGAAIFSSNTLYVSNGGGLYLGYGGGGGNLHLLPNNGTTSIAIVTTTGLIVGNGSINTSARLQVDSTTQGFLPPRMTNAQRTAIVSPAVGLIVYCTDSTEGLYINKSTGWTLII